MSVIPDMPRRHFHALVPSPCAMEMHSIRAKLWSFNQPDGATAYRSDSVGTFSHAVSKDRIVLGIDVRAGQYLFNNCLLL
jgi:hypothetical protein